MHYYLDSADAIIRGVVLSYYGCCAILSYDYSPFDDCPSCFNFEDLPDDSSVSVQRLRFTNELNVDATTSSDDDVIGSHKRHGVVCAAVAAIASVNVTIAIRHGAYVRPLQRYWCQLQY